MEIKDILGENIESDNVKYISTEFYYNILDMLTPRNMILVLLLVGILTGWYILRPQPLTEVGPFPDPVQVELKKPVELRSPKEEYKITGMDEYKIQALVVSETHYYMGEESSLSPVDLALAWGVLTKEPYLNGIHYRQDGRWYFFEWDTKKVDLPAKEISLHSANTHIIIDPNNDSLKNFIMGLRRGDAVELKGYLIRVDRKDGWHWVSSRSRSDSGDHSCEVFYVQDGKSIY